MKPGSFAARVAQPRISFGELAPALAGEFHAVDHQVSFAPIDELLKRSRRMGDLATAPTAAELRLTLPVDARTRSELTGLRASLN